MNPRWYSSRLFWFGLAGFIMLAAGWCSRLSGSEQLMWVGSTRYYQLNFHPTRVEAAWGRSDFKLGYLRLTIDDVEKFPDRLPPAARWGFSRFFLAYWFILVSYTAAWLGALVLWQRRKHRLMNRMDDLTDEAGNA